MRTTCVATIALLFSITISAQTPEKKSADPADLITAEGIKADIKTLASDEFEGRGPGTPGAAKARDFIIGELKKLGYQPGPSGWTQKVPLRRVTNTERKMRLRGQGLDVELESGENFVLENSQADGVHTLSAELVFCGHGVGAPEYDWDDFKGVDLKGKVVVCWVGDPQTKDRSLFAGDAMTYYGRWTYKLEKAKEMGAAGCLIIHHPVWAAYPWLVVQTSWDGRRMDVRQADYSGELAIRGWITDGTAEKITKHLGKTLDELAEMAATREFKPIPLGITVETSIKTASVDVDDENIIAVLPGQDPAAKSEWVIYTAHYDHLGKSEESKAADKIYNGAFDNASGCAGVLAIARATAAQKSQISRSVMFAFVCSEEQGLLGSRFYSQNPLVPVEKTVANINVDGLNVLEPTKEVEVIGSGQNDLEARLAKILAKDGRTVTADTEPSGGYYYRSDHFNFARVGVPALYVKAGETVEGKPAGYMATWKKLFRQKHYHQPSDEFSPEWPVTGGAADARALFRVGMELLQSNEWPKWNEKSEFRAIREKSSKK